MGRHNFANLLRLYASSLQAVRKIPSGLFPSAAGASVYEDVVVARSYKGNIDAEIDAIWNLVRGSRGTTAPPLAGISRKHAGWNGQMPVVEHIDIMRPNGEAMMDGPTRFASGTLRKSRDPGFRGRQPACRRGTARLQ
jgi:hypothetical protein